MGTAKAKSFGLFPHSCARRDPPDRLHTNASSPPVPTSPPGPGECAQPRKLPSHKGQMIHTITTRGLDEIARPLWPRQPFSRARDGSQASLLLGFNPQLHLAEHHQTGGRIDGLTRIRILDRGPQITVEHRELHAIVPSSFGVGHLQFLAVL